MKHFLLVTGQGVTAGVCPDVCTAAYLAFADDWRSSVEAEADPPPQTGIPPQLPPRRPSSIAADAQTRHSYLAYTPNTEHRPSLPPRPFSDTTAETFHNAPWNPTYVAYSPPTQTSAQFATSPNPGALAAPPQNAATFASPPIQRRPVSREVQQPPQQKEQPNPYTLSPIPPPPPAPAEPSPQFPPRPPAQAYNLPQIPPPPPYTSNPTILIQEKNTPLPQSYNPLPSPQTLQAQQAAAAAQAQAQAQAKAAKRDQGIKAGLKMGKMAMQGLAIGAAIVNIASGNGGDIPTFDSGAPDVPDVPAVPVPDTSAYWQPLQDCASMPIQ